ncbi:hypothetical protein SFC66_10210 [Terribacillus saccharophilus]|uniref:hypothetical protein n=1 Tax=Terribacillus saccharophilus TaxID=361277 RepID=UPI003982BA7C
MNDFGELLYAGKTDSNKNGYGFIITGIILFVGTYFMYTKWLFIAFGSVMVLFGIYLLLFKRGDKLSIYENAIVMNLNGQEYSIPKEQISHIGYQELKVRRSPIVNYYPVIVLNDQQEIMINKAFNTVINKDFRKVIESYV